VDDGFADFEAAAQPVESPAASVPPAASFDDLFGPTENKPMSMSTDDIPSVIAVEAPVETEADGDDGFGDLDAAPSPADVGDVLDAPAVTEPSVTEPSVTEPSVEEPSVEEPVQPVEEPVQPDEEPVQPVAAAPEPSIDDLFGAPIEDKPLEMDMFQMPAAAVTATVPEPARDDFGAFESHPIAPDTAPDTDDGFGDFATPTDPPAPAITDDAFGIFEQSTTPTPPTQAPKDPFADFASLI
jgi:hypothetical protein